MQIIPQAHSALEPAKLSPNSKFTNLKEPKTRRIMRTFLLPVLLLFSFHSLQAEETVVAGLFCPDDVWLNCNDELWDLSIYGNAYYKDYGGNTWYVGAPTVDHQLNACNIGKIIRTWNYEDPYWNWFSCSQIIHVSGTANGIHNINWPEDLILEGCHDNVDPYNLPYGHGNPTYSGYSECSQIGVNYDDDVFYFGGDCKKIRRTWTIIDWCNYDPNGWGTQGIWTYVQIIKISNTVAPDLYCPLGVKVPSYDCHDAVVLLPPVSVDHSVCGGSFHVTNNSIYAYANGNDASGKYPIGQHHVTFTIAYGCGINTNCSVLIIVEDAKNPVPYCYGELTVALMGVDNNSDGIPDDGMVTIWASDLNKDSYHPCGYGPLEFSFSPDTNDKFKTFTCADVGENDVRMYVSDHYGGQSYCIVTVDVQNNGANIPDCEPDYTTGGGGYTSNNYSGIVSGRVTMPDETPLAETVIDLVSAEPETIITEELEDVDYVDVVLDSYNTPLGNTVYLVGRDTIETYSYDTTYVNFEQVVATGADGVYTHNAVMTNEMLNLMPRRTIGDLSKVTVNDAKVLHAFITGTTSFDNPYLYLAADVDENMVVNFDDLFHLIKFITGQTTSLPSQNPYWFVEENSTAANPFDLAIMEPVDVMAYEDQTSTMNMKAIMKGDLDGLVEGALLAEILENSTLEINMSTGLEDLDNDISQSVSPNPTNTIAQVNISGQKIVGTYLLSVYATSGKLMSEVELQSIGNEMSHQIDVSEYRAGFYFYNITNGLDSYKGSFIKN